MQESTRLRTPGEQSGKHSLESARMRVRFSVAATGLGTRCFVRADDKIHSLSVEPGVCTAFPYPLATIDEPVGGATGAFSTFVRIDMIVTPCVIVRRGMACSTSQQAGIGLGCRDTRIGNFSLRSMDKA